MLLGIQKQINISAEFDKLDDIDKQGYLNNDFLMGYISAYTCQLKQNPLLNLLREKLENIRRITMDRLITSNNVIELIQTSIIRSLEGKKEKGKRGMELKRFCENVDESLNELVIDQNFLKKRYYMSHSSEMDIEIPDSISKSNSKLGLQCPICCQQITFSTVCPVACGHNLHKGCFQEYFKAQVSVKKFPILCPLGDCGKEVNVSDIQQYIQKQDLEKYFQFSLQVFVDKDKGTNWCPTAGCTAIFEGGPHLREYRCPSCKKNYCLRCQSQFHPQFTCQEYQSMKNLKPEDKQFLNFVKGAHFKQCPSCKFWVQKQDGCDHMTCRCTYEFCYKCGAKYGTCECISDYSDYSDGSQPYEQEQQRIRPIHFVHPHMRHPHNKDYHDEISDEDFE